ncbi:hypothetical protein [Acetobacter sacchari]|nr:hypothetical protein [Acetobacter sacchari]
MREPAAGVGRIVGANHVGGTAPQDILLWPGGVLSGMTCGL